MWPHATQPIADRQNNRNSRPQGNSALPELCSKWKKTIAGRNVHSFQLCTSKPASAGSNAVSPAANCSSSIADGCALNSPSFSASLRRNYLPKLWIYRVLQCACYRRGARTPPIQPPSAGRRFGAHRAMMRHRTDWPSFCLRERRDTNRGI